MSLDDILWHTWRLYRQHLWAYVAIAAAVAIPVWLIELAVALAVDLDETLSAMAEAPLSLTPVSGNAAIDLPLSTATSLLSLLSVAALIRAAGDAWQGMTPEFTRSYRVALARYTSVLIATVRIFALIFLMGITIVGIPFAIHFALRWFFAQQTIVLENARPSIAIGISSRAVRGRWWWVLGVILVIAILSWVPVVVLSLPLSLIQTGIRELGDAPDKVFGVLRNFITAVAFAFIQPIFVIGQTLLYFDLRTKERERASTP